MAQTVSQQGSPYRVAIIGKGALGLLFASVIDRTLGEGTCAFVMDDARFERHAHDSYTVNGAPARFRDVRASEAAPADLVIVATKSTGLDAAIGLIPPLLREDTPVVPVLNGITSERRIAARLGWGHVAPCVAFAMDAARYGCALEYTKPGYLALGAFPESSQEMSSRAAALLREGGVDAREVPDLRRRMWVKFMANVGVNQVTCAFGMDYEELLSDFTSEAFRTYVGAMREVIAVARAEEGVELGEQDMVSYIEVLRTLDPHSRPSMAQDRLNKNPTEVDEFSGEVLRLAEKHGVLAPCNAFLNRRIKEIEAAY